MIDFSKVEEIYLTNNELMSNNEIDENYPKFSTEQKEVLKDHLGNEELASGIYSFLQLDGDVFLGIGEEENNIDYVKVSVK